jgi:hypothetical protein
MEKSKDGLQEGGTIRAVAFGAWVVEARERP